MFTFDVLLQPGQSQSESQVSGVLFFGRFFFSLSLFLLFFMFVNISHGIQIMICERSSHRNYTFFPGRKKVESQAMQIASQI